MRRDGTLGGALGAGAFKGALEEGALNGASEGGASKGALKGRPLNLVKDEALKGHPAFASAEGLSGLL